MAVAIHPQPIPRWGPENLKTAYGHSLMHLDTTNGEMFIDDPAHIPVSGRHVHRERTIHVEGAESERHGG